MKKWVFPSVGKEKKLKSLLVAIIIIGGIPFQVRGENLCLAVVEQKSAKEKYEASSVWEGALMGVFFNAGHIVSSFPIALMEERPLYQDIYQAKEGGSTFFIVCTMNYGGSPWKEIKEKNALYISPRQVMIQIFTTKDGKKVFEKYYEYPIDEKGFSVKEDISRAQYVGLEIVDFLKRR
ncbi:MAG: hypothetical protein N2Z76_09150 [Treponemataceae bacterium]|nr:hypothetical protein [Treponemataceae bacterium]